MNILYFCNVNRLIPTEAGVMKKIMAQIKVMKGNGYNVFLAAPDNSSIYSILNGNGNVIRNASTEGLRGPKKLTVIMQLVLGFCKENDIKVIYVRYGFSLGFVRFFRSLHKRGIKVLVEIPTYPMTQRWFSLWNNIKQRDFIVAFKQLYNNTIGSAGIPFFRFYVDRIVNNNGYERIWGIPVLQISNGVDISSIPERKHNYIIGSDVRLLAVANVAPWHGYDRLIKGLGEYYKSQPSRKVYFDIVGPGIELHALKILAHREGVENYVSFPGALIGDKLNVFYESADIGISVLGVHRVNMKSCDSLKSREYCARQLPFITEQSEFHYRKKTFTMSVPSDETPININSILDFYDKIAINGQLLEEMSAFARQKCSWDNAFKDVINYVNVISGVIKR